MKTTETERKQYIEELQKLLKPGDTVYTVVRHVSQSGMYRAIDLYIIRDNQPLRITWSAAQLLEGYDRKHEAAKASGCGMDMGFGLVYDLGRTLFPDGFGVEGELPYGHRIRPISKEVAAKAVAKGAQFRGRNGDASGWDNDGGYALKQRWM